jgi:hypothetical protein
MPGQANALQFQINNLSEKLKTEKNPVEIAKLQDAIKELRELQQRSSGNKN